MEFSKQLKHAIKLRGLTARKLSELSTIPYQSILNYTRGIKKPGLNAILMLLQALNVSADWLLLGKGQVDPVDEALNVESLVKMATVLLTLSSQQPIPTDKLGLLTLMLYRNAQHGGNFDQKFVDDIKRLLNKFM